MTGTARKMYPFTLAPFLQRTLAAFLLMLLLAGCADVAVPAAPEAAVEEVDAANEVDVPMDASQAETAPAQADPEEPVTVVAASDFVLDAAATEVRFLIEETLARPRPYRERSGLRRPICWPRRLNRW